jgi:hypothetical protein
VSATLSSGWRASESADGTTASSSTGLGLSIRDDSSRLSPVERGREGHLGQTVSSHPLMRIMNHRQKSRWREAVKADYVELRYGHNQVPDDGQDGSEPLIDAGKNKPRRRRRGR